MIRYLIAFALLAMAARAHALPASEAYYCGNAIGVSGGPYGCFASLDEAETWIRQDEGTQDGFKLLRQRPRMSSDWPFSLTGIYYAAPNAPASAMEPWGYYASESATSRNADCGSNCPSESALEASILATYPYPLTGTFVGTYPTEPAVSQQQRPPGGQALFLATFWGSRGYVPEGHGGWGVGKRAWHVCPGSEYQGAAPYDQLGRQMPWPMWCYPGGSGYVEVTKIRQYDQCPGVGNPCIPGTGNKIQEEVDFTWGAVRFSRHYNSLRDIPAKSGLGANWSHSFSSYLTSGNQESVYFLDEKNHYDKFVPRVAGNYDAYDSVNVPGRSLHRLPAGSTHAWRLDLANGSSLYFSAGGRLSYLEQLARPEQSVTLEYCDNAGAQACAVPGSLIAATDGLGRRLSFDYAADAVYQAPYGSLVAIWGGTERLVEYRYDGSGRLIERKLYPDASGASTTRQYAYGETTHVCREANGAPSATCPSGGFPSHLTGIVDESGARYADFTYDGQGRATSTQHANGTDRYELSYLATQAKVVDPMGRVEYFEYTGATFAKLSKRIDPQKQVVNSYDAQGRLSATTVDAVTATFEYGPGHKETQRVSAVGTPSRRRVATDWDAAGRLMTERRTYDASDALIARQSWTYNSRGQVLTVSQTDPATGATRTTTTTYCDQVNATCPLIGLVRTVDGPRTDANDVTTFTYRTSDHPNCAAQPGTCAYRKGDLWKVTNALGQVTETLKYDGAGRVLSVKDPNGVVTDFEYHTRGWLTARKVRGSNSASETDDQITRLEYSPTGLVQKTTLPDGSFTAYTYDAAQRLTDITDGEGSTLHYTLDAAGNRTREDTRDPTGTLVRTLSRVYDTLGHCRRTRTPTLTPPATPTTPVAMATPSPMPWAG